METIKYEDYEQIADIEISPLLDSEIKREIEQNQKRAKVLQDIRTATGLKIDVVVNGGPKDAAAFVTPRHQVFITEATLDNRETALHAGHHEHQHIKNNIFHFEISEHLDQDKIQTLQAASDLNGLSEINLLEGFNEAQTLRSTPANDQGFYSQEVEAVLALDRLAQEHLNTSLIQSFDRNKLSELAFKLSDLAEVLLIKAKLGFDQPQKPLLAA